MIWNRICLIKSANTLTILTLTAAYNLGYVIWVQFNRQDANQTIAEGTPLPPDPLSLFFFLGIGAFLVALIWLSHRFLISRKGINNKGFFDVCYQFLITGLNLLIPLMYLHGQRS